VKLKWPQLALVAGAIGALAVPAEAGRRRRPEPACPPPCCGTVVVSPVAPLTSAAAPSAEPERRFVHLQIALYELREARQDLRDLDGIPVGRRDELLGVLDAAIDRFKKTIEAAGGKPEYIKPHDGAYKDDRNHRHLRHAVRELEAAREQLMLDPTVSADARAAADRDISAAVAVIEKALEVAR
jgi:hypothetical protein